MAAKLPLIVTNVGGNSEAVVDNETGFIVPAKDPNALAKAIVTLSSDRELQSEMGEAGFQRVKENFSLERCAEQYEVMYSELMVQ